MKRDDLEFGIAANPGDTMPEKNREQPVKPYRNNWLWFVALWLVGFVGTGLLVLPFHLMVAAAMHHR